MTILDKLANIFIQSSAMFFYFAGVMFKFRCIWPPWANIENSNWRPQHDPNYSDHVQSTHDLFTLWNTHFTGSGEASSCSQLPSSYVSTSEESGVCSQSAGCRRINMWMIYSWTDMLEIALDFLWVLRIETQMERRLYSEINVCISYRNRICSAQQIW